MKPGDIVELIDENDFGGKYRGRMTVIEVKGDKVHCAHLDYEWVVFDMDDLVVMEEYDD